MPEPKLYVCQYEKRGKAHWCWKRGKYRSQEFDSEQAALEAREDCDLEFSRDDGKDGLDDLLERKRANPPFDYWIIDGVFIMEPYVGGQVFGAIPDHELPDGARLLQITQAEFNELNEDFFAREGRYLDT